MQLKEKDKLVDRNRWWENLHAFDRAANKIIASQSKKIEYAVSDSSIVPCYLLGIPNTKVIWGRRIPNNYKTPEKFHILLQ